MPVLTMIKESIFIATFWLLDHEKRTLFITKLIYTKEESDEENVFPSSKKCNSTSRLKFKMTISKPVTYIA
jgi:hypothetical protein